MEAGSLPSLYNSPVVLTAKLIIAINVVMGMVGCGLVIVLAIYTLIELYCD